MTSSGRALNGVGSPLPQCTALAADCVFHLVSGPELGQLPMFYLLTLVDWHQRMYVCVCSHLSTTAFWWKDNTYIWMQNGGQKVYGRATAAGGQLAGSPTSALGS